MSRLEYKKSCGQDGQLEKLIESLIIMLGRSNRRLDDLAKRVLQLEQSIIEGVPSAFPFPEESYSFIVRTRNHANKSAPVCPDK
jgi:hypothetical protein